MTPNQFKQVFKLTPRPHSPLKQWHIHVIVILAFFVLPLVALSSLGILGVIVELVIASLLVKRYLQPHFAQDYRIVREALQRWAGISLLVPLIALPIYGLFNLDRVLSYFNEGATADGTFSAGMVQAILATLLVAALLLLVWVGPYGYFRIRTMLAERSVKGIKKEELFQ